MEQELQATIARFLERKMNEEKYDSDTMPPAPKRRQGGTVEEEEVPETVLPTGVNRKQLWLLCRNHYCLTFNLCKDCNEKLFQRKEKIKELVDGVLVSFELCWSCTERNMKISEIAKPGYERAAKKMKKDQE